MTAREFDLNFPCAWGGPVGSAGFRTECEDFVVNEDLGFAPDGQGEHWLLEILKRDDNTPWVAKQIARLAGVKPMDVGFCGMKDRRAVTRQWFSVYLPKDKAIDWHQLNGDTIHFLQAARHGKKLRRGDHAANHFDIVLRHCGDQQDAIDQRLQQIAQQGTPNYFGEQRFGRDSDNLHRVDALLASRNRRRGADGQAMVMSAARSWLFNQVLSARVADGSWQAPMEGEPGAEATGPLWGRGRNLATGPQAELEAACLAPWQAWCEGLEHAGLSQERRPLVMRPRDLHWQWQDGNLRLQFGLAPGQFATALLRELAVLEQPLTGPEAGTGTNTPL